MRSSITHYGLNATLIGVLMASLAACGEIATLPVSAGTGPNPALPGPQHTLIPTVNIAPAERVTPQRPDLVATAIAPDYALGPHTASLGLASSVGTILPPTFANGMFVGQHGSWNRRPASGYKVFFVPFAKGQPAGEPIDVLTGFLSEDGEVFGRPVGVALDKQGALLLEDDVGNVIWRVAARIPALALHLPSPEGVAPAASKHLTNTAYQLVLLWLHTVRNQ